MVSHWKAWLGMPGGALQGPTAGVPICKGTLATLSSCPFLEGHLLAHMSPGQEWWLKELFPSNKTQKQFTQDNVVFAAFPMRGTGCGCHLPVTLSREKEQSSGQLGQCLVRGGEAEERLLSCETWERVFVDLPVPWVSSAASHPCMEGQNHIIITAGKDLQGHQVQAKQVLVAGGLTW